MDVEKGIGAKTRYGSGTMLVTSPSQYRPMAATRLQDSAAGTYRAGRRIMAGTARRKMSVVGPMEPIVTSRRL